MGILKKSLFFCYFLHSYVTDCETGLLKMKLEIGDRVVYPFYGAGVVTGVQTCEVLGQTGTYYVLSFSYSNMTLNIPADHTEGLGLRPLIGADEVEAVFARLAQPVDDQGTNWGRRHRENMDKLKDGSLCDTAEVYRYLKQRECKKILSTAEKKMLTTAFHALVSELAYVTGVAFDTVSEQVAQAASKE